MINLRDLQYAVAVAEERHFGRAAERCHVSQPTLSGQLRKLEESLGVSLFERTSRSVAVTPAGAAILQHARRALAEAAEIEALARARRDPLAGPLRLGVIPTVSPSLMPLVLGPLKRRCPKLTPVLFEEVTEALLARLAAHEIDAAIIATTPEAPELARLPLYDEPFWVAYPKGHALDALAEITEADLAGADLLLLTDGHCLRDQALAVCNLGGAAERDGFRATSLETLRQMVAAGVGVTLLPRLAVHAPVPASPDVALVEFAAPAPHRQIAMFWRETSGYRELLPQLAEQVRRSVVDLVEPRVPVAFA